MRFRLDVDGEQRDIEVQPMAGGFIIRIDGAAYRARTRLAKDAVDVRIGAKTLRLRFQGDEAILDDGIHRVRLVEVTGEGLMSSKAPPGRAQSSRCDHRCRGASSEWRLRRGVRFDAARPSWSWKQ